jgi:AraC-like DNA-binding protein
MTATYLLSTKEILWKIIATYGVQPEAVFARAGLTRDMLLKQGARITHKTADRLWAEATEVLGDPCFGLKAVDFWHPSHFNALGYAWLASSTLRQALQRFDRYIHILSQATDVRLEDTPQGLSLTLSDSLEQPARMDLTMAIVVAMCRINFGPSLKPVAVTFIHHEPSCGEKYFETFKCPVYFAADCDSLTLKTEDVDQRLPGGNQNLALINDRVMIRYLGELNQTDIVQRTQKIVIKHLPSGNISDEKVARALNMSVRSLQRRLQKAGTSFRRVLDQTREDLAKNYILDNELDLTEVAFLLGFSEHSAFSRAFRRWTGRSPSTYRREESASIDAKPAR